jgi:hypothetical protein
VKSHAGDVESPDPAGTSLVDIHYQAMCHAIAACHSVDEVKDLRDKARALEVYTRQAQNREAEDRAREIRLRAERRAGELMLGQIKAAGARGNPHGRGAKIVRSLDVTAQTPTLADQGISKRQAADWQTIATLPEDTFERAVRDPGNRATTASMVKLAKPAPLLSTVTVNGSPRVERDTLLLHAAVVDFERKGYADKDPADVYGGMWFDRMPFMRKEP